jgi:hypothetical protein
VRESCTPGSVRGAPGNGWPYRDSFERVKVDKAAGVDKVESGRVGEAEKAERDRWRLAERREKGQAPEAESDPEPRIAEPYLHRPPAPPPLRLLDALRERLRYMHYSLRTEEAYVYWVRGFIRWAGCAIRAISARRRCRTS